MKTEIKEKECYEVPRMEIYEVVNEGILCSSGTTGPGFTDGGTHGDEIVDVWNNSRGF